MNDNLTNFPPEHVFQKEDDDNCGPSCLEMIYRLKKIKRTVKDILKDFHFEPKGKGTYPAQLAIDLEKHGLKTNIIISNPRILSPAWAKLTKEQLIDELKEWLVTQTQDEWHVHGLFTLYYLLSGGSIQIKSFNIDDVKKMIDKKSLVLLCLDEVWLWGHRFIHHKAKIDELKGKTYGHFILVDSYHGDQFHVLDPYPTGIKNKKGTYYVDGNQIVNATLIWSGTILEIIK